MLERILAVADKEFEALEEKAVLDVIIPMRKMILDNVQYKNPNDEWEIGSTPEYHAGTMGHDVRIDASNVKAFERFKEGDWGVRSGLGVDGQDFDLVMEEVTGKSLVIAFTNEGCERPNQFLISEVTYENRDGERIFMRGGSDGGSMQITVKGFGDDRGIIMNGGKATAEKLIGEMNKYVAELSRELNRDVKMVGSMRQMLGK